VDATEQVGVQVPGREPNAKGVEEGYRPMKTSMNLV
jgi:hypothetical protein